MSSVSSARPRLDPHDPAGAEVGGTLLAPDVWGTGVNTEVKRLLLAVREVMVTDDLPILAPGATMREAVVQLAERRGIAIVANAAGVLQGVITTGDLTRLMEREADFLKARVDAVMTTAPKVAGPDELGSAVVYRMEQGGIMSMPVVDAASRVVGVVHLHDLMRAGAA